MYVEGPGATPGPLRAPMHLDYGCPGGQTGRGDGEGTTMSGRGAVRSRWAALGAAVAVSIGGGTLLPASASIDSGERTAFVPITPCRVMDTRSGSDNVGPRATPIAADESYAIQVRGTNGNCTIPTDAVGVVMNVAAVNPTARSFLTVYPTDATRPLAASLNWIAGQPPVSNAVTADVAADGRISFYNYAGSVDVAADIVGYYANHTHDDRYAPKRETLQISGGGITPLLGAGVAGVNGCYGTQSVTTVADLALDLPRGATIRAATVTVNDSPFATGYSASLVKRTLSLGIGPTKTILGATVFGGAQSQQVTSTLLTGGTEVVDANESFVIELDFGAVQQNGVCMATVEIEHGAPTG